MHIKYAALAALSAALLYGCKDSESGKSLTHDEDELPMVEVDVAHTQTVPVVREYTANVEAENVNNISPATMNRILEILVDVGDNVTKGQELVRLDPSVADQQRYNLELLEREYNRAVELLNIGAGTQRSVDQLKTQLDAQRAQYENTMTNTVLRAPVSGVVTSRNYDPGDMTGQQPVLTVGQISPTVKVIINVNENDAATIRRGMPVSVTFDAFEGETFNGSINRISPAVDVASRTFPAEVRLNNPGAKIKPGMFARVAIKAADQENVVVPDRAVVKQTGSANKYVYTYSDGKVAYKKVELGQRLGDSYELLSGIADGDSVVIAGQAALADGKAVELKSASAQ